MLNKIKNSLDLWMAFLTRHDLLEKDHLPPLSEGVAIQKALGVLETMNLRPEEKEAYEDRLKFLRIEANTIKKYEADGFIKGMEKGMEKASYTIALNLINFGLSLEQVSEATKLSIPLLEELKKS